MTGVHRSSYDGYVTEHDDYANLGGIRQMAETAQHGKLKIS